jgi:hypothetical protein
VDPTDAHQLAQQKEKAGRSSTRPFPSATPSRQSAPLQRTLEAGIAPAGTSALGIAPPSLTGAFSARTVLADIVLTWPAALLLTARVSTALPSIFRNALRTIHVLIAAAAAAASIRFHAQILLTLPHP